jgi:nucleoside phosphorylase
MEGAAVVQAARRFRLPCYLFKFVSDVPAHTKSSEIETHIRQYRQAFYEFFRERVLPGL